MRGRLRAPLRHQFDTNPPGHRGLDRVRPLLAYRWDETAVAVAASRAMRDQAAVALVSKGGR